MECHAVSSDTRLCTEYRLTMSTTASGSFTDRSQKANGQRLLKSIGPRSTASTTSWPPSQPACSRRTRSSWTEKWTEATRPIARDRSEKASQTVWFIHSKPP
eukprot:2166170-Prymnesium_polylepis.3